MSSIEELQIPSCPRGATSEHLTSASLGRGYSAEREVVVRSLRPVRLALQDVGPFRGDTPTVVEFLAPSSNEGLGTSEIVPCDVFVVAGDHGTGKSTILACIHGLFDLLSCRPTGVLASSSDTALRSRERIGAAAIRLDTLAVCSIDGSARSVLFTLWYGSDEPPSVGRGSEAFGHLARTHDSVLIGFRDGTRPATGTNDAGYQLLSAIRACECTVLFSSQPDRPYTAGFPALPTVLHFSDGQPSQFGDGVLGRSSGPEYAPAKQFDLRGGSAEDITRQLAVLGQACKPHLKEILAELSASAFLDMTSNPSIETLPSGQILVVKDDRQTHALARLGSAETALLTVHACSWLNMTLGALILIDGLDRLVARKWLERICETSLRLTQGRSRAMLILSTSDHRFITMSRAAAAETGLVWGSTTLVVDDAY